jgi:hypothetical protein
MAIGIYFPASMSAAQYDEAVKRLEQAGAGAPRGRQYHASFEEEGGKLAVFDVWESQEAFEDFGKTLMPILAELGADPGTPNIAPIHNIIKG